MRVAWISSRNYHLMEGGAELADMKMLDEVPNFVELTMVDPITINDIDLGEFDATVLACLRYFTAEQLGRIAITRPVIWSHDMEYAGHWIYPIGKAFVALTPRHMEVELKEQPLIQRPYVNPGYFDTSEIHYDCKKRKAAVWAARLHAHKGLDNAQAWSEKEGVPLRVFTDRPRTVVLREMCEAEYFVLLPKLFDPGPWSVIEAQLAGCRLVVNENVGYYDLPREEVKQLIDNAAKEFWDVVLS